MSIICNMAGDSNKAMAFFPELEGGPRPCPGTIVNADVHVYRRSDIVVDAICGLSKFIPTLFSERVARSIAELQPDVIIGAVDADYNVPLCWIAPPVGIESPDHLATWTGAKIFKGQGDGLFTGCVFEVVELARREGWKGLEFKPFGVPPDTRLPQSLIKSIPYRLRRKDWIPADLKPYLDRVDS